MNQASVEVVRAGGVAGVDAGEGVNRGGVDGRLAAFGDLEAAFDEEEGFGGDEEGLASAGADGEMRCFASGGVPVS